MPLSSALERAPLRDRITQILREQILRGDLQPGAAVRDTVLAESLGASRTPVREALVRLTAEGLLENLVGRGFRVRALRRQDVEEVYPLLWTLEPMALECAAPLSEKQNVELDRLLRRMENPRATATQRHELDATWHRCLLSGCVNVRLLKYIEELRDTLRRYELAYLKDVGDMDLSVSEHGGIAAAYAGEDRQQAVALLREHWHRGKGELLAIIPEETEA